MAKYNIYAVACGVDPKTKQLTFGHKFHTWDECKPYVVGAEGAKYKGFLTEAEADAWLEKTIADMVQINQETEEPKHVPAIEIIVPVSEQQDEKEHYKNVFINMCLSMDLNPDDVTAYLQKQFVEEQRFLCNKTLGLPTE